MRPPALFFDTPRQRARSTVFSSVALSFLAPLFMLVCLWADHLDLDAPFERRLGSLAAGGLLRTSNNNHGDTDTATDGAQGMMQARIAGFTDARVAVDTLSDGPAPGVAVPLVLNRARSHRGTWAILRHALQPLLPGLLRSTALEEEADGLVALQAGGRYGGRGHDDDDAGLPGGGGGNSSSSSHRRLQYAERDGGWCGWLGV